MVQQHVPQGPAASSQGGSTTAVQQRRAPAGGDFASQAAALAPENQSFAAGAAATQPVQLEAAPDAGAAAGAEQPAAADKPAAPTFVPFDKGGQWDAKQVLAQLGALTTVPGPLKAAIEAGAMATAKYCVTLRGQVDLAGQQDPSRAAACQEIHRTLARYTTELALATSRSPLQFTDLAQVASWTSEFAGVRAVAEGKSGATGGEAVAAAPAGAPGADVEAEAAKGGEKKAPVAPDMTAAAKAAQDGAAAAEAGDTKGAQSAGERYRAAVLASLQRWEGATEGAADGRFAQFVKPDSLEAQRKLAGANGTVLTTCITFLGQVQTDAIRDTGMKPVADFANNGAYWYIKAQRKAAGVPEDAFHAATPDMTERPKPGDIIYLTFAKSVPGTKLQAGMFSHVGYLSSVGALDAQTGLEKWTTTDGGQGTAGKYDKAGNLLQKGAEKIAAAERWYEPKTCLIKGSKEAGQGGVDRKLMGWIDIAKMVPQDAAPPQ